MKQLITALWAVGMTLAPPAYAGLSAQTWCPNTTLLGFAWAQDCVANEALPPASSSDSADIRMLLNASLAPSDAPNGGLGGELMAIAPAGSPAVPQAGAAPVDAPGTLLLFITGLVALSPRKIKLPVSGFHHFCRVITL